MSFPCLFFFYIGRSFPHVHLFDCHQYQAETTHRISTNFCQNEEKSKKEPITLLCG